MQNASHNNGGLLINYGIWDYSTKLISVSSYLEPCLRLQFMSRIDLQRALEQFLWQISQMYLLVTVGDEFVFVEGTMSMGLRNTSQLFKE